MCDCCNECFSDDNGEVVWFPPFLLDLCFGGNNNKKGNKSQSDGGIIMACAIGWVILIIWWIIAVIITILRFCGYCRRANKHNTYTIEYPQTSNATGDPEMELPRTAVTTAVTQPYAIKTVTAHLPAIPSSMTPLPEWWEACLDPSGRSYYRNNYKMTTSWYPPTAEQISLETEERRAQENASAPNCDLPPPAYDADDLRLPVY